MAIGLLNEMKWCEKADYNLTECRVLSLILILVNDGMIYNTT